MGPPDEPVEEEVGERGLAPTSPDAQLASDERDKLFTRFFDNQARELQLKEKELELRAMSEKNQYQWATSSLSAQVDDKKDERRISASITKQKLWGGIFLSALVLGFLIAGLWLGKDAVVLEIVKDGIFISAGGAGGFALGKSRSTAEAKSSKDDDD